jgi:putative transposase
MKKITISLSEEEERTLKKKRGEEKLSKRERNRIEILLQCHRGKSEKEIGDFLEVTADTIWRVKKRHKEEGVESAIQEKPRSGQPRKYSIHHETELVSIACSEAPEGSSQWTLGLLQKQMRAVQGCETINRETIRLILKKTNVSLGSRRCGVLGK